MKNFIFCLSLLLLFGNISMYSQISDGGLPVSFESFNVKDEVPVVQLPSFDVKSMLAEDELNIKNKAPIPYRYAKEIPVDYTMENSGKLKILPGGHKLWRITINSKNAHSLSFLFEPFKLPKGAKVFLYNEEKTSVLGAFTHKNNKKFNSLATTVIAGDKITVEYFEPANAEFQGEFGISKVYHAYKNIANWLQFKDGSFGQSGSCNIDINCPTGAAWQTEKLAVCRILMGGYLCSGTLLNNTANDGTPYFLTANHCTGSAAYVDWVFNFNWEVATCGSTTDPYPITGNIPSVSGCDLRATTTALDFCLVEMSSDPPASFNPYLCGWDNSGNIPANMTGIHHPSGDVKKICVDNDAPVAVTYPYAGGYDANSHWHIAEWEEGVTEGGSSGSAIFDENHRVVGDLTGGLAACGNVIDDYYQMFSHCWEDYTPIDEQLKHWLDPSGTGQTTLDGMDPYNTGVTAAFSGIPTTIPVGNTVTFTDASTPSASITSWDWNFGAGATPPTQTGVGPHIVTYTTVGLKTVTLTVSDGTLTDDEIKTDYIMVEDTVINADFTPSTVTTVNVGGTVNFTDISSPSATITSWDWDFGDPAALPAQTANTQGPHTITYNTVGFHTVSLTVSNGTNNDTETKTSHVEVVDPNAINADFIADNTIVIEGGTVNFTDLTINGPATSWNWDFGNGLTSIDQNPLNILYDTPGFYTVALTVSDGTANDTETKIDYIEVLDSANLPVVDFIANFTTVFTGGTVDFTDLTTNSPNAWSWTFDGGLPNTDTLQNPTNIQYDIVGVYNVRLIATNPLGTDTLTKILYITVVDSSIISDTLIANFQATTPRLIVLGETVSFEDLTYGYPTEWEWIFEGGTPATSTDQHPTNILYDSSTQTFDVTLIVKNGLVTDTLIKEDYIVVTSNPWWPPEGLCDTITNVLSSEIPLSFRHLTPDEWGYFPGHNGYTIKAYADEYTNYMFSVVRGLIVPVIKAYEAPGSNSKVRFTVWDKDSLTGLPGNALEYKDVPVGSFTPYLYHHVEFDNAVPVNGKFFVGFELLYSSTAQDTFAVYMASNRGIGGDNTLFVKKGTWQTPSSVLGDTLNTSMAIQIIGCLVAIDVEGFDNDSKIIIYPNPSQNIINIELIDINAKNIEFNFFDIMGRKLDLERNIMQNNRYQFNFINQAKGIYFVNINIDGKQYTKKISIIR